MTISDRNRAVVSDWETVPQGQRILCLNRRETRDGNWVRCNEPHGYADWGTNVRIRGCPRANAQQSPSGFQTVTLACKNCRQSLQVHTEPATSSAPAPLDPAA